MGFGFGLGVGFTDTVAFEGQGVAGIGVGEDGADFPDSLLGQAIDGDGAPHALVADMIGYDPALPTAIGGPN